MIFNNFYPVYFYNGQSLLDKTKSTKFEKRSSSHFFLKLIHNRLTENKGKIKHDTGDLNHINYGW